MRGYERIVLTTVSPKNGTITFLNIFFSNIQSNDLFDNECIWSIFRKDPEQEQWRRSWGSRDENKDDFWAAIQSNYNYIMDTNLIDSCKVSFSVLQFEFTKSFDLWSWLWYICRRQTESWPGTKVTFQHFRGDWKSSVDNSRNCMHGWELFKSWFIPRRRTF